MSLNSHQNECLLGIYLTLPPLHYLLLSLMDIPSLFRCQMQSCQLECRRGIRGENDVPLKLSPRLVFTAWSLSFRICQWFLNFCGINMWWRLVEAQVLSAVPEVYVSVGVRLRACLLDKFPSGTVSAGLGRGVELLLRMHTDARHPRCS